MHDLDAFYNENLLRERQVHGKRTAIRVTFEVYGRKSAARMDFHRLRGLSVILNLPSADQAELAIDTVTRVLNAMDGKLLVKSE